MVIAPFVQASIQPVEILSTTVRGEGGFGHTGKS
jgi:dUTP pyrophosphatase